MFFSDLVIDNLCTQGFHIIDNFFVLEDYQKLRGIALKLEQENAFKNAKIGATNQAQRNSAIRTDKIFWLDEFPEEQAVQHYLQRLDNLKVLLNERLFLGLHDFETHFAIYPPGSFYKKHIDQFQTTKTRKISFVYYLNEDWSESCGGNLKLYSTQDEALQEVIPLGNRFICFNSELPHEVLATQRTRYSITGWMRTSPAADKILF